MYACVCSWQRLFCYFCTQLPGPTFSLNFPMCISFICSGLGVFLETRRERTIRSIAFAASHSSAPVSNFCLWMPVVCYSADCDSPALYLFKLTSHDIRTIRTRIPLLHRSYVKTSHGRERVGYFRAMAELCTVRRSFNTLHEHIVKWLFRRGASFYWVLVKAKLLCRVCSKSVSLAVSLTFIECDW